LATDDEETGGPDSVGQAIADNSDNRLTEALAAAQIGEWHVDLDTREVTVSAWSRKLIGLPAEGVITLDDLQARRHPDDREHFLEVREATLADPTKAFIRQSYRYVRPDGDVVWVETRGTIRRDPDGRAQEMLGVMLDVTDREECRLALEQGWQRFEAALANTAITLFEQDRELRYTWVHNPPLGYDAHRVIGKTDVELMGPEFGPPIEAKKRQVLTTGQALRTEVVTGGSDGLASYDLHIEPLRGADGDIIGVICAAIRLGPVLPEGSAGRARRTAVPRRDVEDRDLLVDRISARLDRRQRDRGLLPLCIAALERKLNQFGQFTAEDRDLLTTLQGQNRYVPAKERLQPESEHGGPATWLVGNGWVYSYDLLTDGRRQVIGFHLPGDLIGHPGLLVSGGHHQYATASDCVLCSLDQRVLAEIMRSDTPLAEALHWAAARDAAIIEQHLVSLGRRSAIARLAHLLLELGARLETAELADPGGYRCPLTQEAIADALGLTNVHVNRLLRRLRDQGLLTFVRGFVTFQDKDRLMVLAEYDPAYLDRPMANWGAARDAR
jgi:PAS domain S-box-containing protein